jgi:hypothetical protein
MLEFSLAFLLSFAIHLTEKHCFCSRFHVRLFLFPVGDPGRKKCNNLINQQTPKWLALVSFHLWFASLWLVYSSGI